MDKHEIKAMLDETGLSKISSELVAFAQMSIRLTATIEFDENLPIGASKIGGRPDLPPNYSFPEWKNTPLGFLAQINLANISKFHTASDLPSSGLLSFFYTTNQDTWGFDPKDKGSWQVYYFESLENIQRTEFPANLPESGKYQSCTISFFEELTMPPFRSSIIEDFDLDLDERKKYIRFERLFDKLSGNKIKNRILGYPNAIQGDMPLECQLVSNGIYCGDAKQNEHLRYKELEPGAKDWKLLLQLDSEEETAKMTWGDVGRVYFWIHKTALENREFEKAWFQLQCY